MKTIGFLWIFSNTVGLWFTACLSIFYCVKITSCKQPLFLRMKQRISVMVPKLLLGSLLVSSVSSIPSIWPVSIQTLPTCLIDITWTPAITSIAILAYPSGHSLILILINPKLRQALVRILRSIKCHLKEGIF
ncbi:taste receptor type 2 member 9-like [Emydura macquarii macquarii]|uniref:taste receptor type 2 member 9-like n=1 Tax=Emydura macquarii macquarii TaxID=1129001 RepID=UPI00352AE2D9